MCSKLSLEITTHIILVFASHARSQMKPPGNSAFVVLCSLDTAFIEHSTCTLITSGTENTTIFIHLSLRAISKNCVLSNYLVVPTKVV
jgi:hypothetical protein